MAVNIFVTYGVILAGSWVNAMLYMLELVLCLRYFQRSARRPLVHKIGIGAILLFDTVCTMGICANVFITFEIFMRKIPFSAISSVTTLTVLLTSCTATVEQFFLCHLYFVLTKNRIFSLLIATLIVVHFGFSLAASILISTVKPSQSAIIFTTTAIGSTLCAVMDILIAICLGRQFFKVRNGPGPESRSMRKIFFLCLSSGAIVASNTLIMMILLLTGNVSKSSSLTESEGRIYALTLLGIFLSPPSSKSTAMESDMSTMVANAQGGKPVGRMKNKKVIPTSSIYTNPPSRNSRNLPISEKDLPPLPGGFTKAQFMSFPARLRAFPGRRQLASSPTTIASLHFSPLPSPRLPPAQFATYPSPMSPTGSDSMYSPPTASSRRTLIATQARGRLDSLQNV
ncbi:hypothetical protein B0H15DRAFT_1007164 [Mycena belliarum]|uniref:Uncharacterized protein n=1 Tax=Mycena belliarum TaxID=1033014 RepID=A0AAD6XJK9_9AGAR|nr:hypothetical protein B0H15DRAFT_1007164 [Mycena belliae]